MINARSHSTVVEDLNVRTSRLARPYPTSDAALDRRYLRLGAHGARPYAWYTGTILFSLGIALMVFAMLYDLYNYLPITPMASIALATALGIGAGFLSEFLVNALAVMPRGLCFIKSANGKSSFLSWAFPTSCYLAIAVLGWLADSSTSSVLIMDAAFALLLMVPYQRYGDPAFLICSIALFVGPVLLVLTGLITIETLGATVGQVLLTESIILAIFGIHRARNIYAHSVDDIDFDRVKTMLDADNPTQRLLATVFCTGFIDPHLMGPLLVHTRDEERVVAYEAQVAFSNMWGPTTDDMLAYYDRSMERLDDDMDDDLREMFEEEREDVIDEKRVHQEEVEEEARKLPAEQAEGFDALCALAQGERVIVPQARLVAIEVLGCVQSPRAYAIALQTLTSDDPDVAHSGEVAFYGADPSAIVYLERLFASGKAAFRSHAVRAAAQLLAFWNSRDPERCETARALLEPSLDKLLSDPDLDTRAHALSLLPPRQPRTLAYLRRLSESEPEGSPVRAEAVRLLGRVR